MRASAEGICKMVNGAHAWMKTCHALKTLTHSSLVTPLLVFLPKLSGNAYDFKDIIQIGVKYLTKIKLFFLTFI